MKLFIRGWLIVLFLLHSMAPAALSGGKWYDRTEEEASLVRTVTDGDTIELENGEKVRYLGIDTPEMMRRVGTAWVYDPKPYAEEATRENRALVEGKKVRLEFDQVKRDRFGRLLAYVYVRMGALAEEIFVNAHLIRKGLAKPLSIPPNTRYAEHFEKLALQAEREGLGLWGP